LLETYQSRTVDRGPVRLSVGAVNVQGGNFTYFDSARQRLDVRHIAASGALPPGFACGRDRW